jgi:hypothetical protein
MVDTKRFEVTELTAEECESIIGGSPIQYAMYFIACFKAGFYFGYTEIGPAVFGE